MIFLYRFDVIGADALATDDSSWDSSTSVGTNRHTVFLHTNYERPIPFVATGGAASLEAAAVPPVGSAGAPSFWLPTPGIESNGIDLNSERGSGRITVHLPRDSGLANLYANDHPNAKVYMTLGVLPSVTDAPLIVWAGEVMSADFDEQRVAFECAHFKEVLDRSALTGKYTRTCRSPLFYGSMCGLERDKAVYVGGKTYYVWREDALVGPSAYNAATLALTVPEAAAQPNGFFNGGYIMLDAEYDLVNKRHLLRSAAPTFADSTLTNLNSQAVPSGGIKRSIQSHVGSTLILSTPLTSALAIGTKASLFAGCDKLKETCKSAKFNNYQKFRGYLISIQNPYETGVRPMT